MNASYHSIHHQLMCREVKCKYYKICRFLPSFDLADFVEHYWVLCWNLNASDAYVQGNLPYHSQSIVVSSQATTGIYGIRSSKIECRLVGSGRIFGVRFWPGAFYSFYRKPVSDLSDRSIPMSRVFDVDDKELEDNLAHTTSCVEIVDRVEDALRKKSPKLNNRQIKARKIIENIEGDRQIDSAQALLDSLQLTPRALQRIFDTYIGVTPKWVINRYRMLDAVELLNNNVNMNIAGLSYRLGYFDQAHFTKAFTKIIGFPPARYNDSYRKIYISPKASDLVDSDLGAMQR